MDKKFLVHLSLVGMIVIMAMSFTASLILAQDAPTFPTADLSNPSAPFIYSHEVAIAKGATAEWRKLEGVALDAANKRVYCAVTEITKGMADTEGDLKLEENKCGVIFMGELDDQFNVGKLTTVVVGGPYNKDDKANPCSVDSIANPDNIFVDAKGNLWIGG